MTQIKIVLRETDTGPKVQKFVMTWPDRTIATEVSGWRQSAGPVVLTALLARYKLWGARSARTDGAGFTLTGGPGSLASKVKNVLDASKRLRRHDADQPLYWTKTVFGCAPDQLYASRLTGLFRGGRPGGVYTIKAIGDDFGPENVEIEWNKKPLVETRDLVCLLHDLGYPVKKRKKPPTVSEGSPVSSPGGSALRLTIKMRILLTSESPQRKRLLEQIGLKMNVDFVRTKVISPDDGGNVAKLVTTLHDAKEFAKSTARQKIASAVHDGQALARKGLVPQETVVVGVDTVVFCDGRLLDRPLTKALEFASDRDRAIAAQKAERILKSQRDKTIQIITGLVAAKGDDIHSEKSVCVVTEARMKPFGDSDIERYVRTDEPLDKAGALGIQGKGVALFESIKGSYTNVVGLPLLEFFELLEEFGYRLPPYVGPSGLDAAERCDPPQFSAFSVGDINYDLVYDRLESGFFKELVAPGKKVEAKDIRRGAGGTAVTFARGAKAAGFTKCHVLGSIGVDTLGAAIEDKLRDEGISTILPRHSQTTSLAIILRDMAGPDTSLTLTDAHQSLHTDCVDQATPTIRASDVFYLSGYCLMDPDRKKPASALLSAAKKAECLVILDVVRFMDTKMTYDELQSLLRGQSGETNVEVLVSELPEIAGWLKTRLDPPYDRTFWKRVRMDVVPRLRETFVTVFLRTPDYAWELIASPAGIEGPRKLEYPGLEGPDKLGFGDRLTAGHVYDYLSPRIVVASSSRQRPELLRQIVHPKKIEVRYAGVAEQRRKNERPEARVVRLAREKARKVIEEGLGKTTELVIAADTEIVTMHGRTAALVPNPQNQDEARRSLGQLRGQEVEAITGICVVGVDPQGGGCKEVTRHVKTTVTFRNFDDSAIDEYVRSGEPIGRAGGFAIQARGGLLVKSIEGSYSNVVGLPLEELADILKDEFKMPIWDIDRVSNWHFPRPL